MEPIGDRDGDGELAARIAAGDEAALVEAYDRHGDVIYGSVVRFLRDPEAAAEIVQETYLALWQRAATFDRDAGSLLGWLMRIARNRAIDRLRAAARRPQLVSPPTVPEGHERRSGREWPEEPGERAAASGPSSLVDMDGPESVAVRRWTQSAVRASVASLPDAERAVLVLAYDAGLTQSEIADRLGLPVGTVKSRTRRALARLRDALAIVPDLVEEAAGSRSFGPGVRLGRAFGTEDIR
jgi:RNA polymerase sigma-70 factor (ECF subfamily)